MTNTATPAQVAAELGVDTQTIRRWCEWHSEHLSAGATPSPGGRRGSPPRVWGILYFVRKSSVGAGSTVVHQSLPVRGGLCRMCVC
jgi:transposase-like protein